MMEIKKIICLILALMLVLPLPLSLLCTANEEEPLSTLMFASDFQQNGPVHPLKTLTSISNVILSDEKQVDSFILCGDLTNESGYSNYNGPEVATQISIRNSKKTIKTVFGDDTECHFVQGNHDPFYPDLMDTDGAHEYDNYILYVLNTQSSNPWGQGAVGAEDIVIEASKKLDEYLRTKVDCGDDRPIIIVTHVPLHYSGRTARYMVIVDSFPVFRGGTGDNMYSRHFFNVINKWAEYLNIVFLFGHNHDKGYDNYLGSGSIYLPAGSNILIPEVTVNDTTYTNSYTVEKLNFTYMNAGYIGFIGGSESEENAKLTCSLIEIYKDKLEISRYGTDGLISLSGQGSFCNNPDYPDKSVFKVLDESILTEKIDSPFNIERFPGHIHSFKDRVCEICGLPDRSISIGDVDCDGKLTPKDINIEKRILLGDMEFTVFADMNCDDKITTADVQILIEMVLS